MDKLIITTFGGFSLSYNGVTFSEFSRRSQKMLLLLEYLIVHKDRDVPRGELIELLWGSQKGADNPENAHVNALKTQFSRLREELNRIVPGKNVISSKVGSYSFCPDMEYYLDFEEFERLYKQSHGLSDISDKAGLLVCCFNAIELYHGDFLHSRAGEHWVVPLNVYFRHAYIKLVIKAIEILEEENRNDEIISLCREALLAEPGNEIIKNKFAQMTDLYNNALKEDKGKVSDFDSVIESLTEDSSDKGAYYCDYEGFKKVYSHELRFAERNDRGVNVFLLSITDKEGRIPEGAALSSAMGSLSRIITANLRIGDVYAKFSPSQFMMLLRKTDDDICEMILERLERCFTDERIKGAEVLVYEFQPIV
ncbi:MAG: hypothetical protein FWD34_02520 [Oscillospiraceae bacterium]|nr:hypothetical protein [Oscillospiraceae bacterium]